MSNETIVRTKVLGLLEEVQEFIDTNPNDVTALTDSALLIDALCAGVVNWHDAASVN